MGEKGSQRNQNRGELARSRRRFSRGEKQRMLAEATGPGQNISKVARRYGITTSLLFRWRKLLYLGVAEQKGASESEVESLRAQVRELQWLLGKKTHENEILRNAIEVAGEQRLLSNALSKLGELQ